MKLIKLQDKFILVNGEEIKEGDYRIMIDKTSQFYSQWEKHLGTHDCNDQWNKIIAGIPELPKTDFSLLKEEDCKEIGWVDVEELADSLVNKVLLEEGRYWNDQDVREPVYYGIIEGFKTAQSLNDKMFSLEDMRKALLLCCEKHRAGYNSHYDVDYQEIDVIIQSLQQTSWDVEVEMGYPDKCCVTKEGITIMNKGCMERNHCEKPKITNNSIKVIRIL